MRQKRDRGTKAVNGTKHAYRVGSMFAGIGGICLGFKEAGAEMVWANELDRHACETYRKNLGSGYLAEGDIKKIDASSVPDLDILTAGFPCQAFSIAGYRKGFNDDRGVLFYEVTRLMEAKKPRVVFMENVKNLVRHDGGNTFKNILQCVGDLGYVATHKVLNTKDYGNVPQNRERIYIVAFRDEKDMSNFSFPDPIPLDQSLEDIIKPGEEKPKKLYYGAESMYHQMLESEIAKTDAIYQLRRVYVRENKSGVCPTLTANMGGGGHNVPLVRDMHGIRKLSPEECLRFQGFPPGFEFPCMGDTHKYKQAGNSVSVPVIRRIAENIISAMESTDGASNAS